MDNKNIIEKIEKLRKEMHELFEENKSIDKEVLKKSRELDKVLNEFEDLIKKK